VGPGAVVAIVHVLARRAGRLPGDDARDLLARVAEAGGDLVVAGRGSGEVGPLARALLRDCPVPVVVVPPLLSRIGGPRPRGRALQLTETWPRDPLPAA
jgi:hypothetical protein